VAGDPIDPDGDAFNPFVASEREAFEQARSREPDLTLADHRERLAQEYRDWVARREEEKEAIARARRREKEARVERFYSRVVTDPRITHKRLELLDLAYALLRPGETWADFVDRLNSIDSAWNRLIEVIEDSDLHERQCVATTRDGIRCHAWAVRGSDRCKVHLRDRLKPPHRESRPRCQASRTDGVQCQGHTYREGLCYFHWSGSPRIGRRT
jgi:hypothetical protein